MKKRKYSTALSCIKLLGFAIIVMIIGAIIAIGILFVSLSPDVRCFKTLFPEESNIERLARIELPSSASNMEYEVKEYGDLPAPHCVMMVQFEMSPEDYDFFRMSTLAQDFEMVRITGDDASFLNYWFNFHQPKNSLYGYASIPCCSPEVRQWIIIDTQSGSWDVYVIVSEYWLD